MWPGIRSLCRGGLSALQLFCVLAAITSARAQFCRRPPELSNGAHTGGGRRYYRVGSTVRYYCRSGYRVQGFQYNVCCYDRSHPFPFWSHPEAPKCVRKCYS